MKITFEFNTLAEDFDPGELELTQNAHNYYLALSDIYDYLRDNWKYREKPDDIDTIYERYKEILTEYKIDIP